MGESSAIKRAAKAIQNADALVIAAGAGMGVDSGLPDFRGAEGFWRAYPPLAALGIRFEEIADPEWFQKDPALAWGFYGHRLNLYRATQPHEGFTLLRQWAESKPGGYFVYTSNVDGQFQKAGFDPEHIAECHGSIHNLQCMGDCKRTVWSAEEIAVAVDPETLRATMPLPTCPTCNSTARPNLLMFGDWNWISQPYTRQDRQFDRWLKDTYRSKYRITIVECGAGRTISTIRWFSEQLVGRGATLIRINPRDCNVPFGQIALPFGAREALTRLDAILKE